MVKLEEGVQLREDYNTFVGNITLTNIRLGGCSVNAGDHRPSPSKTGIEIKFSTSLGELEKKEGSTIFDSLAEAEVIFTNREDGAVVGNIRASYVLKYVANVNASEEIVQLFVNRNVPMNSWPYLREFVQNTMQRMGWNSFILPPLRPDGTKKTRASKSRP